MTQRKALEQRLSTLLQEDGPLDEFQQDEVVETMAVLQSQHDRFWTRLFSALSSVLGVLFFVDAGHQWLFPFQMKHRGLWEPFLSHWALIGCETAFGISVLFCCIAVAFRGGHRRQGFWWTPVSLVIVCCSFFSFYMLSALASAPMSHRFRFVVLWLPSFPLMYCILIYYVIHLLDRSYKDVQKLKQRKYVFKSI